MRRNFFKTCLISVHCFVAIPFNGRLHREPLSPLGVIQQMFQSIDIALLCGELVLQAANLFFERFDFEIFPYDQFI